MQDNYGCPRIKTMAISPFALVVSPIRSPKSGAWPTELLAIISMFLAESIQFTIVRFNIVMYRGFCIIILLVPAYTASQPATTSPGTATPSFTDIYQLPKPQDPLCQSTSLCPSEPLCLWSPCAFQSHCDLRCQEINVTHGAIMTIYLYSHWVNLTLACQ